MANRRVESPETRKSQILMAARSLLAEKSYLQVVLDDVAERAGVAKGTLYLYFHDKEDLYVAVVADLMDDLDRRLQSKVSSSGVSARQNLKVAIEEMLGFADENKDIFLAFGPLRSTLGRKAEGGLKDRLDRHLEFLSSLLKAAVKDGGVRAHDAKTGSLFMVALTRMFLMRKFFHGRGGELRNCADEFLDFLFNGLGVHP